MNVYKDILKRNLPRLLNHYNLDSGSKTYGFGDRLYWGWKISDFSNGTMQGGVHSLSIAVKLGIVENELFILNVIDAAIRAIDKIRAKNGSMLEAYPGESSFCVTALVAFDVLSAIRYLDKKINERQKQDYLIIIKPLIDFIVFHNEEHAIISNHIATAVAAVTFWNNLTGDDLNRDEELLGVIYSNQSEEGWYKEYEGADPGYQTLCTYYLACVYEITKDKKLLDSLIRSGEYLKYFVHPDGTIGGLYGTRNTEVYYPAGTVALARSSEEFAKIAKCLQYGYNFDNHLLPSAIDAGNFIPLLNSYAVAALHYEKNSEYIEKIYKPVSEKNFKKEFSKSGIFVCSTVHYYAIVNFKKGGTLKVFDKISNTIDIEDGGVFGKLKNNKCFSTQHFNEKNDFKNNTITAGFFLTNESYPSPVTTIFLRLLSLTAFKSLFIGNLFKRFIVKLLMTGKNKLDGEVIRKFEFTEDKIQIYEDIIKPEGSVIIGHIGKATSIHMASSGYLLAPIARKMAKSAFVILKSVNG